MMPCRSHLLIALCACVLGGCSKSDASHGAGAPGTCHDHAVCADHFFIDTAPLVNCNAGEECTASFKLSATGAFHVNDEYGYQFKADLMPGVQFVGTDPGGQNIFTKSAGDWHKLDEKTGQMTVKLFVGSPGTQEIAGTFKLSVCSANNCLVDERGVKATIIAL